MGPSCVDVGGIATIGGSGRRVVGVSRAYGSNSPVWSRAVAAARSTTRRSSRNFPVWSRAATTYRAATAYRAAMPSCADAPVGARAPHIVTFLKPCQRTLGRSLIVPVLECVLCCFVVDGQRTSRPRQYNY